MSESEQGTFVPSRRYIENTKTLFANNVLFSCFWHHPAHPKSIRHDHSVRGPAIRDKTHAGWMIEFDDHVPMLIEDQDVDVIDERWPQQKKASPRSTPVNYVSICRGIRVQPLEGPAALFHFYSTE